jgi:hypothetical protein
MMHKGSWSKGHPPPRGAPIGSCLLSAGLAEGGAEEAPRNEGGGTSARAVQMMGRADAKHPPALLRRFQQLGGEVRGEGWASARQS